MNLPNLGHLSKQAPPNPGASGLSPHWACARNRRGRTESPTRSRSSHQRPHRSQPAQEEPRALRRCHPPPRDSPRGQQLPKDRLLAPAPSGTCNEPHTRVCARVSPTAPGRGHLQDWLTPPEMLERRAPGTDCVGAPPAPSEAHVHHQAKWPPATGMRGHCCHHRGDASPQTKGVLEVIKLSRDHFGHS